MVLHPQCGGAGDQPVAIGLASIAHQMGMDGAQTRPCEAPSPSARWNLPMPPNLCISASHQPQGGLARAKENAVYFPCPFAAVAP